MDTTALGGRLRWLGAGAAAGVAGAVLVTQIVLARPSSPVAYLPLSAASEADFRTSLPLIATADVEAEPAAALVGLVEPADAPAETADAPGAAPSHERLAQVPFRTQRDGSPYAGSNCGPAALAMVLASYGVQQGNDDLRYLTHTYQGTWPRRGGTALQHMAHVGEDFGLNAVGLYEGDSFRRWSVADVRAEIEQGHPVIALVKYRLLPGRDYSTVRYDHYVVLWDVTPDGFVYNDPIYPDDEGDARFMTTAQLDAAMAPTLEPRQAVAFS
jgi:hypothetical protein